MKHATLKLRIHKPDYSDVPNKVYDWSQIYGSVAEIVPEDVPVALKKEV